MPKSYSSDREGAVVVVSTAICFIASFGTIAMYMAGCVCTTVITLDKHAVAFTMLERDLWGCTTCIILMCHCL